MPPRQFCWASCSFAAERQLGFDGKEVFLLAKNAITFSKFQLFYGDFHAIHPVDLTIPAGKITALLGPSGCGKSSCLRAINRMHDHTPNCRTEGVILIGLENILSPQTDVLSLRKRVGMVFQRPNPFPKSIYENVIFGPKLHGEKRKAILQQIAEDTLTAAGLWNEVKDRLKHPALGLSGGQQQRLCIARALAVKPEILLLDEPTAALDPVATAAIEALLRRLRGQYTLVLVTHDLDLARRLSDRAAFFHNGRLLESGSAKQLFSHPQNVMTKQYLTRRYET